MLQILWRSADGAHDEERSGGRLDSVQILRAVAALAVVLFHLSGNLALQFDLTGRNPLSIGRFGVDLFFAISGFIICYSSQRDQRVGVFAAKRLARIVPLYWLLTFGVFGIALILPRLLNQTVADTLGLIKSLFFIPHEMPNGKVIPILSLGWTLNYEMFFYGIFAVSLLFRRRVEVAIAVLASAVLAGAFYRGDSVVLRFWLSPMLIEFIFGCCIFLLYKHRPAMLERMRWLWIAAVAALLVQMFVPVPLHRVIKQGIPSAFLLASLLSWQPKKGLITAVGVELGNASYSMYLVHLYVIQFCAKIIAPHVDGTAAKVAAISGASLLCTVAASIFLYRRFEKPVADWLVSSMLRARKRVSAKSAVGA